MIDYMTKTLLENSEPVQDGQPRPHLTDHPVSEPALCGPLRWVLERADPLLRQQTECNSINGTFTGSLEGVCRANNPGKFCRQKGNHCPCSIEFNG